VRLGVVGGNGRKGDAVRLVLLGQLDEGRLDVLGVGAVVAREDDHQHVGIGEVRQRARVAGARVGVGVGGGQVEGGGVGPQVGHLRFGQRHGRGGLGFEVRASG
jgi:hypothetical protein